MITELTHKESIALAALKKIEQESVWILGINKVLTDFSVESFRLLIHSLNSQDNDNPAMMNRILGPAYESVIALKSSNSDQYGKIQTGESGDQHLAIAQEEVHS